jgi:hypothetical protein
LAIPKFSEFQAKARQSEVKTNLNYISTLAEAFFTDDNTYIVTLRDGMMSMAAATNVAFNSNCPSTPGTELGVLGFNPTPCAKLSYNYGYAGAASTFAATGTEIAARVFMCAANPTGDAWRIDQLRDLQQTSKGGEGAMGC